MSRWKDLIYAFHLVYIGSIMRKNGKKYHFLIIILILYCTLLITKKGSADPEPGIMWNETYIGGIALVGTPIQETSDEGYIIISNGDSGGHQIIKTDSVGTTLWNQQLEIIGRIYSIQETRDGGFIVIGRLEPLDGGDYDIILLKTNSFGIEVWREKYGGSEYDGAYSVQQTTDNGYIIAGSTRSFGIGEDAAYLIKTDVEGNEIWSKTFSRSDYLPIEGYAVQQTTDGGYIIAGSTAISFNYLIKTDHDGNEIWNSTIGASNGKPGYSVQQTRDGGYIVTGSIFTLENDWDAYLIKVNSQGTMVWNRTIGNSKQDEGYHVRQTVDGGYIIVGFTTPPDGIREIFLVKTDSDGYVLWSKSIEGRNDAYGYSVQETSDEGYIIAGRTSPSVTGKDYVYLVKVAGKRYRLEVVSKYGSVSVEDIHYEGSSASFSVSPTTVSGSSGTRYIFTGWSSDDPGGYTGLDNSATVRMISNITETAQWKTQYYLTVKAGEGGSSLRSSGWYDEGTHVTITAKPDSGYSFESWIGKGKGSFTGTLAIHNVTVDGPITQTAFFHESAFYTLTVTSTHGTTTGEGIYEEGTNASFRISLIQIQQNGERHTFTGWTSTNRYGYTGPGVDASVVMLGDVQEKAEWEIGYYLSVQSEVGVEGEGWYADGRTVQLDADSPRGFLIRKVFQKWTGDTYSKDPSVSLVMNAPKSVSAEWVTDYSQAILFGVVGVVVVGGGGYMRARKRRTEEETRAEDERVEREVREAADMRKRIIDLVERADEVVVLEHVAKTLNVSEDEVKGIVMDAVGSGLLVGKFSNNGHTFITDKLFRRILQDKLESDEMD